MRRIPARIIGFGAAWIVLAATALVVATPVAAEPPAAGRRALPAAHPRLPSPLEAGPFEDPLSVTANLEGDTVQGDVRGLLAVPFADLQQVLARPQAWCDVLTLHFNVKSCRPEDEADSGSRAVPIRIETGRKVYVPPRNRVPMVYAFDLSRDDSGGVDASLAADEGPLGVHDVRIELRVTPLRDGSSRLHLHYSYRPGLAARLATSTYLATVGRNKVGFTVTGYDADGKPEYVTGMAGAVERNALRYYLAVVAYLDTQGAPAEARLEARLARWFDLCERYPLQLREMPRAEYLEIKRRERRDQEVARVARLRNSSR
jgi:hypothetical protein